MAHTLWLDCWLSTLVSQSLVSDRFAYTYRNYNKQTCEKLNTQNETKWNCEIVVVGLYIPCVQLGQIIKVCSRISFGQL